MNQLKKLLLIALLALPLPGLAATQATLYKNPSCGCCEQYADYLRDNGYEVEVVPTHDLLMVKEEHEVPEQLAGCHTTLIDGYVFEGHIPVASVDKVLKERPMIRGLSVPGMPAGSPGMGGARQEPLQVYYLTDGEMKIYATH